MTISSVSGTLCSVYWHTIWCTDDIYFSQVQDLVDVKTEYYQGIDTPGNVNNVDVTVCADALFGITNAILSGLVTSEVLDDPVLQVYKP